MRAHLQEAANISAHLADKNGFHRRLHVVVNAAPEHPAIEVECLVMRIEHQLLGLAEVEP
jgi:hypothetical protein